MSYAINQPWNALKIRIAFLLVWMILFFRIGYWCYKYNNFSRELHFSNKMSGSIINCKIRKGFKAVFLNIVCTGSHWIFYLFYKSQFSTVENHWSEAHPLNSCYILAYKSINIGQNNICPTCFLFGLYKKQKSIFSDLFNLDH
jgi:hypothetical protein